MCTFWAYITFNKATNRQSNRYKTGKGVSKLNLCEGGSLLTAIFKGVYTCSCLISVCPFVTLLKAMYAHNLHIVLTFVLSILKSIHF